MAPLPADATAVPNYTAAEHATHHNTLALFFNAALGGGGTGIATKTTTYTVLSTDLVILADAVAGGFSVTAPAVAAGRWFIVKKIDGTSNLVTILPASGTIDGSASDVINAQWQSRMYVSNGTVWFKI